MPFTVRERVLAFHQPFQSQALWSRLLLSSVQRFQCQSMICPVSNTTLQILQNLKHIIIQVHPTKEWSCPSAHLIRLPDAFEISLLRKTNVHCISNGGNHDYRCGQQWALLGLNPSCHDGTIFFCFFCFFKKNLFLMHWRGKNKQHAERHLLFFWYVMRLSCFFFS